ncbi:NAD(P)/FAD-dependent oxidoreductase [Candidatus Laterigemmans baculatus]|uniref:NAD(P)/FAD-dependent oxidoreductase n=1 Tax=Candidatus Laterigemmans baculatus TaxID=2770505 RepID=UPI0013DC88D8|nr:NAD(P)/FAD-dependent oxidoreductase [Candidatus Laterigemmans baculatus]
MLPHVVIIGGGFAGINAAKVLGQSQAVDVTIVDQRNHHLFQPLLYQVAMAGLDPSDIASPIRSMLRPYPRVRTLLARAQSIDVPNRRVLSDAGPLEFDYLLVACGATHSYFGNPQWEQYAPGLKNLEQATEIRRRVLVAFEKAERSKDPAEQAHWMTFVIVGGGPTGVELAGAIAEMASFALARDFRAIDATQARVILVDAVDRILNQFDANQASWAHKALNQLGVEVVLGKPVTAIDARGINMQDQRIDAGTVLWAAGVQANRIGQSLGVPLDRAGRVVVGEDLSIPDHPNVFVAGDLASVAGPGGRPLPGLAPVAMQEGRYVGKTILAEIRHRQATSAAGTEPPTRKPFQYWDKGQMATIGRRRAILQSRQAKLNGFIAWLAWLLIHIYYLSSFRNRVFVFLQWTWSYLTFSKGARLIIGKEWRQGRAELISPLDDGLAEQLQSPPEREPATAANRSAAAQSATTR